MAIRNPSPLLTELGANGDPAAYLGGDGLFHSPSGFGVGDIAELGIGVDTAVAAGDVFDGSQLYSDKLYSAFGLYYYGPPSFPPTDGVTHDGETWIALGDQPAASDVGDVVVTGLFQRVAFAIATPRVDHATGTYNNDFVAALTCGTPGVDLRYTLDGSDVVDTSPLAVAGNVDIDGSVTLAGAVTLKFRAFLGDAIPSAQGSTTYTLQAATPTFDPPPPSLAPLAVTVADGTAGAAMFYTTNGAVPTTSSTPYTVPVAIVPPQTIKAIATKAGYVNSAVGSGAYTAVTPALIAALFAGGEQGAYYDFSNPEMLYQDVARSTPVTVTGDPVAFAFDLSGNGNHAAAGSSAHPTWNSAGFAKFLGNALGYALPANLAQPYSAAFGFKNDVVVSGTVFDATTGGGGRGEFGDRGGLFEAYGGEAAAPIAAVDTLVHTAVIVYNGATSKARFDGAEQTINPGNAGAITAGTLLSLGGEGTGAGEAMDGRIYQALVINRALTPTERANVEALFLSLM